MATAMTENALVAVVAAAFADSCVSLAVAAPLEPLAVDAAWTTAFSASDAAAFVASEH